MPSRHKTFRCTCVICCDSNPDGRDVLLSERTAHLLHAKREEATRSEASLMGTSIQRDTLPKESRSSSPPSLPAGCYLDSSVPSSQSTPSPSRHAARTEKREKSHLTRKAHATFNVVERRANEILNRLAIVDNTADVQVIEDDISVIRLAFQSVKRKVGTIDSRREMIARLFMQMDAYLPELRVRYPPSIAGPFVYSTGHLFDLPINTYNPLAQLVMFLLVICSTIMGLNRRMSDFILNVIRLLLVWACRDFNMHANARQAPILKQLPSTVETVLARFDLDGRRRHLRPVRCAIAPILLHFFLVPPFRSILLRAKITLIPTLILAVAHFLRIRSLMMESHRQIL